jgi:hypothetical protein
VDGVVTTPCVRCKATGQECVIGSSNRGGRRVRKRPPEEAGLDDPSVQLSQTPKLELNRGDSSFMQQRFVFVKVPRAILSSHVD